ncbi:MAG: hypothetical protein ACKOFW_22225, partial [Planctomycetaceae bacterium]
MERNRDLEKRVGPAREYLRVLADDIPRERLASLFAKVDRETFKLIFPAFRGRADSGVIQSLSIQTQTLPSDDLGSLPRVPFGRDRASAAVALLHLGEWEAALKVCDMTDDPEALTQFMFFCRSREVPVGTLLACLDRVSNAGPGIYPPQVRYALLIALGEYPVAELAAEERERRIEQLAGWYLNDPSSTVHGAAGWLLRQWGATARAEAVEKTQVKYAPGREWFTEVLEVQSEGDEAVKQNIAMTFIVFPAGEYLIGSVEDEPDRSGDEVRHVVKLTRPFAVLDREVTIGELSLFDPKFAKRMVESNLVTNSTRSSASWYDSVEYCRWLGRQQGLAEEEQSYADPDSPKLRDLERAKTAGYERYPVAWPLQ